MQDLVASLLPRRASDEDALAALGVVTSKTKRGKSATAVRDTATAAAATVAAAAWASVPAKLR